MMKFLSWDFNWASRVQTPILALPIIQYILVFNEDLKLWHIFAKYNPVVNARPVSSW